MIHLFKEFALDPRLLEAVEELGFTEPTPIQRDAIPPALEGRDVLACAMTGSGKTAAFLLPILQHLLGKPRGVTRVLILTPTRELAAQIEEHFRLLARRTPLKGAAVFGGVPMGPQERAFRAGVDVIVATPGRLLDHLSRPYARLDHLTHLVLDEADRMLDMGFLPDIRRVLAHLPARRQTLLFSATLPAPIAELAREMLRSPATLNVERRAAPATGVSHMLYPVAQTLKSPLLLHLLQSREVESAVVFTRTKHRANRVAEYLTRHGVGCERLHGNRSQSQRTAALSSFKSGESRVLVATDIAARGIDVQGISHVINFDLPGAAEDYIHRVGRTARAEATGDALTFVSPEDEPALRQIEKAIGRTLPRAKAQGFDYQARAAAAPVPQLAAPTAVRNRHDRPAAQAVGRRPEVVSQPGGAESRRRDHAASGYPARGRNGGPGESRQPSHAGPAFKPPRRSA